MRLRELGIYLVYTHQLLSDIGWGLLTEGVLISWQFWPALQMGRGAVSRESSQAETEMLRFRNWLVCTEMKGAEGLWAGTESISGIYTTVPGPWESVSNLEWKKHHSLHRGCEKKGLRTALNILRHLPLLNSIGVSLKKLLNNDTEVTE